MSKPYQILFISEHAAQRAPLATAIANKIGQGRVVAKAAGIDPQPLETDVITAIKHLDTEVSEVLADAVGSLNLDDFDIVIALCERSAELVLDSGNREIVRWDEAHQLAKHHGSLKTLEIELYERIQLMLIAKHIL